MILEEEHPQHHKGRRIDRGCKSKRMNIKNLNLHHHSGLTLHNGLKQLNSHQMVFLLMLHLHKDARDEEGDS